MEACIFALFVFGFMIYELIQYTQKSARGNYNQPKQHRLAEDENSSLLKLFVLDAAENGVFVPGAERVFEEDEDWAENDYRDENPDDEDGL